MGGEMEFFERFEWAMHVFLTILLLSFLAFMQNLLALSLPDTIRKVVTEFRDLFRLEVNQGSLNAMGVVMYFIFGALFFLPESGGKIIELIRQNFGEVQALQAEQSLTPFYFLIGLGGFTLISVFLISKLK